VDRRTFLRALALSAAGLACTRTRGTAIPFPGIAGDLSGATHGLNVFLGGQEFVAGGPARISMGLVSPDGAALAAGAARAWIGIGEIPGEAVALTYRRYRDEQGTDPAGFYTGEFDLPGPGIFTIVVRRDDLWGSVVQRSVAAPIVRGPGARAIAVATPTFERPRRVANVCTRLPPCPMHREGLDEVLGVRPVVFTIASPKYCSSRTCGPVVDEIVDVRSRHAARAAFIHAEVFATDGPERLSPTSRAWGIDSEPWTFVIDEHGRIAARFEGPVVAPEIETAFAPVLRD
jgi:hypothetical protein